MPNDYFTLDEAQNALPRLKELLGEARELKSRADAKILYWKEKGSDNPVDLAMARGQVEFLLLETRRRVDLIHKEGVVVKDIDRGLLDFPGWIPGEGYVYLCWRWGEQKVVFWHRRSEGFAGRKPLDASVFSLRKHS